MSQQQPTAVGAFIFAGGFTLGVKRAGFEVLAQLENGKFGVATTERNHPGLPVHVDPATWPTAELGARGVDFVYGNPPCAPFSVANASPLKKGMHHDWWKRDARVSCIHQEFSLLETLKPRVWAWESVQPAFTRGRELVDELTHVAGTLGYSASYVFENSAHLGVPQQRRRFFCVFHDVRIDWQYPDPKTVKMVTVREAFDALNATGLNTPPVAYKNTYKDEFIAQMIPGEGPRETWERLNPEETWVRDSKGKVKGRPGFNSRRLVWDKPSNVHIGGAHLYHPEEHRLTSVKESQVICGYPPSYEFVATSVGDCYTQMARAVMPPVGQWLGENVIRAVRTNDRITQPEVWLQNLEKGITERLR